NKARFEGVCVQHWSRTNMAGLVKPKKHDWKDSNLALFGSDLEKQVKKASAATEKAWAKAGERTGVQIWRIVKFKVAHWPKDDYGKFFSGDSYIILKTYKKPNTEEFLYDLHFWIGKYSTQDEYGTAAYKTVELDIFLGDKPVQHREVQGHESASFKSYFKDITVMKGGADTGFRHVEPTKYVPRLMHFRRDKRGSVTVKEVACFKETLDSDDVFIFDAGLQIFQWNGNSSNKDERFRALQYVQKLRSERGGRPKVETLEEDRISPANAFNAKLPSGGTKKEKKKSRCC
ncbi:gelsolin family protein, partial [Salmonella sp. s51933]|uniref:gelsolin family protein n=1 Tax=Salmonella sp. s51933 TaxID=3160127 RepID=UPI003753F874